MLTFPVGYGGRRATLDELRRIEHFANLHPELRRRFEALFVAADGRLGLGQGWRDPGENDREWARRQALRAKGVHVAPMQPSPKTWHTAGAAGDLVGDLPWAKAHASQFGLVEFSNVNREPWHFQLVEIPHARPAGADPNTWVGHHEIPTPHTPVPIPAPVPHEGDDDMVLLLEDVRTGAIYKCSPGGGMIWIQDGNVALELFKRRDEAAAAPDGRSPVDGMRYHYLRHGGDHVVVGYGPIVGDLPPGTDRSGRVG
jgi:hypothetical protein